ncbi:MAG: carbohydrate ABC transporter permease [Rhodanobacter sp.]|nr:MAG: carbohydrate ABC transporter permease [Rhodanobacter sp.]TAL89357.1 MAG: carbohydrate ABC transporter permease [Rhodanobacter sp.]TAM43045.1 MAG: carbohydrate ABC transporter permease [Rhodanobacter sp.]TAN25580.1 MAG: carbohydrate ABC transporter permease [Rhodanobacter sp.]
MKKILRRSSFYLGLLLFTMFAVFPVIWMVITAFKQDGDLYNVANNPFIYNLPPTLKHITFLFTHSSFPTFLRNSAFIGVVVVIITLLLAVPAAYSLSRLVGHWGERSGIAVFLVYLIPPTLLFIPLYQIVSFLRATNTVWALILVYPTITVPFCTWLLLGFFKSMPRELEESALIDGCSRWQSFLRIALPLAAPGIATCIVFAFALSISDYIYAAVFVSSTAARTVSAGVPTELIRGDIYFWQSLMAAAAIVSIPLAVAYGLLFDRLVKGFQS